MIACGICLSLSDILHLVLSSLVAFMLLQMALFHSFYGWIVFHYIYVHIFFIQSSVSGHLGCFHVLATMNNAAMNIEIHVSFWIIVLSGYTPRSGLLGWMVIQFLVFWGTSIVFSTVAVPNLHSHQQGRRVPYSPHHKKCTLNIKTQICQNKKVQKDISC